MEINVVHLSSDYFVVPEEDMAHLQFGPREAVFQKPSEKDNHLKALYMRGHINGKPVIRMLVDGTHYWKQDACYGLLRRGGAR